MMKFKLFSLLLLSSFTATLGLAAVQVPEGYESEQINQNFSGGFDYLPNGDIIGMYVDLVGGGSSTYIGIIDANGDGSPSGVDKKYDFGASLWGAFVKVSPDGSFALFAESTNYKVYSMNLTSYEVAEIVPTEGSFDGAYDCAFINNTQCYISANPAFGTTNKVFRTNLSTGVLTEIVSVDSTFSGAIDIDDEGNLYYVKNTGVWPLPDTDAFTLFRFDHDDLDAVSGGAAVLGVSDAEQLAVLDGGFDVAWHSSGAIYVSDNNHGKVYKISSLSNFITLSADLSGGFSVLALYKREQPFGPNIYTEAKLVTAYAAEFGDITPPVIYQVTSVSPPLGVAANGTTFSPGDQLVVSVVIQQQVLVPFDGYVVFVGPAGIAYSSTPRGFERGIKAYISDVPGLQQDFERDVVDLAIPQTAPVGSWTVYAGIVSAGATATPANALAIDSIEITVE